MYIVGGEKMKFKVELEIESKNFIPIFVLRKTFQKIKYINKDEVNVTDLRVKIDVREIKMEGE